MSRSIATVTFRVDGASMHALFDEGVGALLPVLYGEAPDASREADPARACSCGRDEAVEVCVATEVWWARACRHCGVVTARERTQRRPW